MQFAPLTLVTSITIASPIRCQKSLCGGQALLNGQPR
jgi:hypothetical protein